MSDSVVLDPVDLQLLRLLQNDARITYRDLAAQVGVAPSTCLDRVTRLRRCGVILGHRLQLDPAKLGRGLQAGHPLRIGPQQGFCYGLELLFEDGVQRFSCWHCGVTRHQCNGSSAL